MVMAQFLGTPKVQFFDNNGDPLSGGLLYSYVVGTTTNKATYPSIADSSAATNANTNPVVLDSRGEALVVLAGPTKLVLKDSLGNLIWTVDNVNTDTGVVLDASGNKILDFGVTASAVNYIKITNNSTGLPPKIEAKGEANTGIQYVDSNGNVLCKLSSVASAVNYITTTNSATGVDLSLVATGSDTNIGLKATTKGTGAFTVVYQDTRTNTDALAHVVQAGTLGTPASGIGTGSLYKGKSSDEEPCNFGSVIFRASDVTAGSEDTYFAVQARVAGAALTDIFRFSNTGSGGFYYSITGAPTANRTITLPDTDFTLSIAAAATQAQMEAATSNTVATTPLNAIFSPSSAKCWANVSGGGTATVVASLGVTSLTDGGTGIWTMNLSKAFSSTATIVGVVTAGSTGNVANEIVASRTTTAIVINIRNLSGTLVDDTFSWALFGTLA